MAKYSRKSTNRQIDPLTLRAYVVEIAIAVQEIQNSLSKITATELAQNILGISRQSLHEHIQNRKKEKSQ